MKISIFKAAILTMAFLFLAAFQGISQGVHIVGDGLTESQYPPNTQSWSYNWSSMLYTSDEMGGSKTITKIAYDQITDYAGYWEYAVLENQKIYLKMIDEDEFDGLAYEDPDNASSGYTLVFDGTIQFNLGWSEIDLINDFEYDGSKSLIVHWENHRGTSAPIINVKFNASATSGDVFKALGGDNALPTSFGTYIADRPNAAFYYVSDGPAAPANPIPANNSYKGLLHTDLEFVIGENTTSYDVYFGTDNPPTTLLVNSTVSGPGTYDENPSTILGNLLDPHTRYYWQVVAKDGANTAESQVWSFLSQGWINDFPYETSFEDEPINPMYADTIDWEWQVAGSVNWQMLDYDAHSGVFSVGCNVWADATGTFPLRTPRINLGTNQRVSFWWKHDGGDGTGMDVFLEITTDGGDNWTTLHQFDDYGPMDEYEQFYMDLTSYSGDNCYLRWRYEAMAPYIADYFKIDDLLIETAPEGSAILIIDEVTDFPDLAVGTSTYISMDVKNVGSEDLVIDGSTLSAPFSANLPITIAPGFIESIDIHFDPTAQGSYSEDFEFTGDFEGDGSFQVNANVYQIDYNFFENGDASTELPENWMVNRTADPYDIYTDVTVTATNYDAYSAPNAFKMMKMNDTISPLMLFTKGVGGYGTNVLSFYAKKSYDSYDVTLEVGLSDDPLHTDAFQVIESINMTDTYQMYEVEFSSTSDEPYIVFNFVDGVYASVIWLDDIEWDAGGTYPPYCPVLVSPDADAVDADVMMGLNVTWTSGGGNPTGYNLSIGTDAEATNLMNNVDVGNVLNYDITDLVEYGQEIFWKVTAYNAYGESTGCGINSFTVMDDPVQSIPFFEDFDEMDALGERLCPLGWTVENANNDNFPWDVISDAATPGMAHSTPNAMHMVFSLNQMDDYLMTPPLDLTGGTSYEITFWFRTMGDQWVPDPVERLKVLMGTDNNAAAMTTELYANTNLANQDWESTTIGFTAPTTDEYYIAFYAYSDPNQGLLLVDDVEVDFMTGLTDAEENSFSVYPNPANQFVKINSIETIKNIELFDIQSRLIYSEQNINEEHIINTEDLNRGSYLLRITTEEGTHTQKLIIQ